MIGGLMKTTSRLAIAAAASFLVGGFALTPAKAADLGGDCCADLEERVAELEATTVRKGNRKVSVTLYGWVNQAVTWWDNGEESDVYIHDNGHGDSRLGVKGEGTVRPGLVIGYKLEMGFSRNEGFLLSENDHDNQQNIRVRQEYWYIKDDHLGQFSVGHQYPGSAGTGAVEMGGASSWESYSWGPTDDIPESFQLFSNKAGYTGVLWYDILPNLDPGRQAVIKYTSPTMQGFTFSASWGEDDRWDVGLLYSNTFNNVTVSAGVGYYEDTDNGDGNIGIQKFGATNGGGTGLGLNVDSKEQVWGASLGLAESTSGIYGEVGYYNYQQDAGCSVAGTGGGAANCVNHKNGVNAVTGAAIFDGIAFNSFDSDLWYGKIGVKRKWNDLGETDFYGEYMHSSDLVTNSSDADVWGVGLGQDVDAVGATAYLSYRHFQADLGSGSGSDIEDMDVVTGGMVVPF